MAPERDSVTLLHLSDMQFGRNHRFGNLRTGTDDDKFETLFKRLEIDLELLKTSHGVVPEGIVVTGDLAEKGMPKEFDDAFELLDKLSELLSIPRHHIAMVPGNHDVNRNHCAGHFGDRAGDGLEAVPPYWPKWKNFANMFSRFYVDLPAVEFHEAQPWSLWEMPDLRMVVAGLNSTMKESHLEDSHFGHVGEAQLDWFKKKLLDYAREEWLVLGLVHHNVVRGETADDENLRDADKFKQYLASSLDLLLHGHTHNARLEQLGRLPVLSTGSAALKLEQRLPEVPNQYQCLRLSSSGIERWTRRYDPGQERWIADTRCSEDGDQWITKEVVEFKAFGQSSRPARIVETKDPSRYLKALREECSHFDVQGLKFGDNRVYRFPIDQFYIPLNTSSGGAGEKRVEERPSTITLQEALRLHRKLFVVGDPGAGKSTFLKRVAYQMCQDWTESAALPVLISAAVLAKHVATNPGPADAAAADWIPLFLGAQCELNNRGLDAEYFRGRLRAGGCHVLIDGLDETADEASRHRLVMLIRAAASAFDGCKFVVTSRPEGKVQIAGFEEALISDLEPEAIREFLGKLAKQLYAEDSEKERVFREDLLAAVNGRREIRKMTRNPVMLTALAVLQHNNVKLPEKRVDLYGSILDWLSKQRAKPGRMAASDCLLRLRELALEMQRHEDGRQKQVPLVWAAEKLRPRFANREAAQRFLLAEQSDSGIVVSRGKDIAFWHLTFQEYLAALEIAGWEDDEQHKLLLEKAYQPEWRESVMLYGGLLFNAGPRKVDAFLRRVLDQMGTAPSLAERAQCVGLIGGLLPDLVGYKVVDGRYEESLRLVMDIFDKEKWKSVPFEDRLKAAEALGQAGDSRLAKHEWVEIPDTKDYWIGAQKKDPKGRNYDQEAFDQETLRKVDLKPYRIGKYPITMEQYSKYLDEGGGPEQEPADWVSQLEHPNWPVVNVSLHQASAYCAWAGGRLPSEEEWERAARGPDCTKYPWGNSGIDPTLANFADSQVGHPTPVGLYPAGVSAEGAFDLIGNVWEWTSSPWEEGSENYVWRGGAFYSFRRYARSSFRYVNHAVVQYLFLGFRVAWGIP